MVKINDAIAGDAVRTGDEGQSGELVYRLRQKRKTKPQLLALPVGVQQTLQQLLLTRKHEGGLFSASGAADGTIRERAAVRREVDGRAAPGPLQFRSESAGENAPYGRQDTLHPQPPRSASPATRLARGEQAGDPLMRLTAMAVTAQDPVNRAAHVLSRTPDTAGPSAPQTAAGGTPPERHSEPVRREERPAHAAESLRVSARSAEESDLSAQPVPAASGPVTHPVNPGDMLPGERPEQTSLPRRIPATPVDSAAAERQLIYPFRQWGEGQFVVIRMHREGDMMMRPSDRLVGTKLSEALRDSNSNERWHLDEHQNDRDDREDES